MSLLVTCLIAAAAPDLEDQEKRVERLLTLAEEDARLELYRVPHERSDSVLVQGTYSVLEDRTKPDGRRIALHVLVLPARSSDAEPDPVFVLHGGPGAPATSLAPQQLRGWIRESRDVVFVDQRGTGRSNPLTVPLTGDDDPQVLLDSYFVVDAFRAALPEIEARADISQYTTPNAVDDFDEVRAALGYETVNLRGGSYGTRSALVFMRRHPDSVRTATLQGVQPIAYLNPLPHARGAQESLDLIFDEVEASERYREAFPELRAKFAETLARLAEEPATVTVTHPVTKEPAEVSLSRNAFAEAVRLHLYTITTNRRLPRLLMRAHAGDFTEFAEASIQRSRGVRQLISWGTLIAVTESEDIWRIDRDEIDAWCHGTFLGTTRIDEQLAIAEFWPSGRVSEDFGEPVSVDVPTLLWSGTHDPATTPAWGEEAARHLPKSLHLVVPGGHGVSGREVNAIERRFLDSGTVEGLDVSALDDIVLPPLEVPGR